MTRATNQPQPDALVLMGRIGKPHGVRGDVRVRPETDDPGRFEDLEAVYVGKSPETAKRLTVSGARVHPMKQGLTVVLGLNDIDGRDAAEALRGLYVYAVEDALPPLDDDEFFLHDFIGLAVVTDGGEPVGTVRDVMELPAHPVCVVERPDGSEILIPAVGVFIEDIDLDAGRLIVRPIEGLF